MIPATSMLESRFRFDAMRHFWRQSSDGIDLDHGPKMIHPVSRPAKARSTSASGDLHASITRPAPDGLIHRPIFRGCAAVYIGRGNGGWV